MHDFYASPDVSVTEDACDAFAVQVAESASVGIFAQPSNKKNESAEAGEETEASALPVINIRSRYDDCGYVEEEHNSVVVVEDHPGLEMRTCSSDNRPARAFKHCVNEVLTRRHVSKPSVLRPNALPSLSDFYADVCLAARRVLSMPLYWLFCKMWETDFEKWTNVPENVRSTIMQSVGKELIRRGIFDKRESTKTYWMVGRKNRAPKPVQLEVAA